ncbi:MAG: hypothetical protein P8L66_13090 [Rhodospirillaceae bacterium]|jgi:hypothetical protein|nr:hypothetical protein [Rhodospirillaceae bacterium]
MTDIDVNKLANAKSKGKRPYFFDDPAVERVLSITMAVATELAVTRERLDTVERLLEAGKSVTKANIDAYRPDDDASKERQQWHADYIARILRIVHQELEAVENEALNADPEKLADDFAAT